MKQTPRISEAEWVVMKVAWRRAPLSASDIVEEVSREQDWHPKTVKTLLNRLLKKGALGFEKEGRAYLYYPRVKEADCVAAVSDSFLERVFGGALQPMLAHFVKRKRLSAEEAKQLKRILERGE
jgi:BlaI family penicillinase repressor